MKAGHRKQPTRKTMEGQIARCKIVVVGDTQCGKIALLHVFAKDCYPENYVPTVFENYTASFEIEKQRIELNMWDTSDMLLLLCALSLVATISGDMKRPQWVKVFAEEGRSTVLHCSLSHQQMAAGRSSQDAKSSGKWTKEDGIRNSKAILSLTPSGIEINGYRISPRFTIQQIQFLRGDFSLHIQSVKYEDAGRYAAKIQYGDVKQDCHILLQVIRVRASPSGLFLPGSSVTLTCSCTDPSHLKEVLWYHNGTLRLPTERNRFAWSQMTLPVIGEAHGGEWRCEYRYRDGSRAQAQYQLQVQGIAAPASNLYTVYAPVGSRAELPCFLKHDSQGETRVQWDQTTALGRTRTIFTADTAGQFPKVHSDRVTLATDRKRNYSLSISVVSESDAGQYSCSLTLHKWRITRQIRLVMLKVTPEKNRLAQLGSIVRLNCSLSEESGIEQYTWTQKTAMVNDEKGTFGHSKRGLQRRQYTGQTLELSPVSQDDIGPWVCTIYANNKTIGKVTYVLEVTGAQNSGPFVVPSGKISYAVAVLILFLLVLTAIAVLVLHNRRRRLSHFSALEMALHRLQLTTQLPGQTEKLKTMKLSGMKQ